MTKIRNRFIYIILVILVILLGLSTRKFSNNLPNFIASYSGDVLWSLMIFLFIGLIFNRLSILKTAISALAFSYLIEISQLYHSPWIDQIRRTSLGGLILGFGFLWSDLVCYTIGIFLGVLLEELLINKHKY